MIKIVGITEEDFTQYKKPSMFIAFPYCTFKCERECGKLICQNSTLAKANKVDVDSKELVNRYLANPITKAIVCGGLDPIDSLDYLLDLLDAFREKTDDDIVIYTGYTEEEIQDITKQLFSYKNIIIKYGRFIPDQTPRFDQVLGIELASNNQYAVKIS